LKSTPPTIYRIAFILAVLSAGILFGRESASFWYVSQILIHAVTGTVLAVFWLKWGWKNMVQPDVDRQRAMGFLATLAALSGIIILFTGVLEPFRWVLFFHIITATGISAWMVTQVLRTPGHAARREMLGSVLLFAVLMGSSVVSSEEGDKIVNQDPVPLSFADNTPGGELSPFFPSQATTSDQALVNSEYFLGSQGCGRSGCHVDAVEQWSASAHHLSSFNNQWYRKSIEYLQEVGGTAPAKWCAGCHDPALLFSGKMELPVADLLSDPAAHAGLACVSCHTIKTVRNTGGNGAYTIEVPSLHALATHKNPVVQFVHDRVMKLDPGPHRAAFMKPMMVENQAAFCSTCHKVHLDKAVNDYRWLRGFNTYDNWQASGVSGEGARSFYQPENAIQCTDCHMPLTPSNDPGSSTAGMKDHRFIAANTAVALSHGDDIQLEKTIDFLEQGHLSVDIFAVSPHEAVASADGAAQREMELSTTFAIGEEAGMAFFRGSRSEPRKITGALASGVSEVEAGSTYRLDIVVRSLSVGHFFPTGTTDAQEAWLEVDARDATGKRLVASGWMNNGVVDSTAHFYRSVMVDANSNRIDKRNAFASRGAVYVNLIPPGGADVAHYVLDVPDDAVSPIHIAASLNYRKFSQEYTEFAFGGTFSEPFSGHFAADSRSWTYSGVDSTVSSVLKELPELPVVRMASDQMDLVVSESAAGEASKENSQGGVSQENPDDAETGFIQWNDYGIALLREGDLAGAVLAFSRVNDLNPDYADGWVNLARVYLSEGAYEDALGALVNAESIRPGYYKTRYFMGLYYKLNGLYAEAISAFEDVLETHPRDRVVLNDLGRSYYLDEQLDSAIEAFKRVLGIDAEDLTAHYNLMLIYQAMGDEEKTALHQARYESFKADESSRSLTRRYRLRHSADNNEASAIHVH
jgi:Flp pilus assembly protein TadD